jgi:hypothetical protein
MIKHSQQFILFLLFCLANSDDYAQPCTAPPGAASNNCTTPGSIPLTDGANVNTGQEYHFTGIATFGNVSVNGGTLRICGNLTLTGLNFNQGKIIVEPTGTLNYGGSAASLSATNQEITNYGDLTFNQNYTLTTNSFLINYGSLNMGIALLTAAPAVVGSPDAFLVNEPNALMNVPGLDATINNVFINRGTTVFGSLTINGTGSICMGPGSVINTNSINNNSINSVTVESGNACISYSNQALLNNQLSTATNLFICRLPGSQNPSPANFGSATVVNPCTSCQVALPVLLRSFSVTPERDQYLLEWVTASEDNVRSFVIESSSDGVNFQRIGEVSARNIPSTYTFRANLIGKTFLRLKILDIDGRYQFSRILLVDAAIKETSFVISNNPLQDNNINIVFATVSDESGEIYISDLSGRRLWRQSLQLKKGISAITFPIAYLPIGVYQLTYQGKNSKPITSRLLKAK